MIIVSTYLVLSYLAPQLSRLQARDYGAGRSGLVRCLVLLLYPAATRDRLVLHTTGMQTCTEQRSDPHRPAGARLGR
jgi:hypothetical protein